MTYNKYATWRDQPVELAPFLSVVIPTFNESRRIVPTIASIASHLSQSSMSFEIIVSDDGSTDDTQQRCAALGLRNVRVIGDGRNRGKGAAVRAGVNAAHGRWVLFTDADLSTPIEEIDLLLNEAAHADVVIGSRALPGAQEAAKSRPRKVLSGLSRRAVSLTLGLDIADSQCGFKLFTREAADLLFSLQRIDGFGFDAEILFLAARRGLRVIEVPVRWVDAPGSTVDQLRAPVAFVRDLARIRARAWSGAFDRPLSASAGPELRVGVVTALPPSKASLTEYGEHLVAGLGAVDEVGELIVFAEDSEGAPPARPGVTIVPAWTFDSFGTPWRLVRSVRRHRPDVVLFNLHFTSFASRKVACALGLAMPLLLRVLGTPTVVLTHNLVDTTDLDAAGYASRPLQRKLFEAIGRFLTRVLLQANHVVTTMPEYVEILRSRYGAANVSLTPHGAFECPPLQFWDEEAPRRLLAFGKFGTYKRVEDLIAAFRILRSEPGNEDVELVIAGTDSPVTPGYLASIQDECTDLPGVHFTGYVEEEDVAGLFHDAHVVVFPYTGTTGSSGPLHQAGSYGRAVVAPRVGDFIDLIEEEGYVAQAFTPGDVESLTEAIATVLADPALMRSMGTQNHAAASGLPLADIAEWHVMHLGNVVAANR